ncbi:MAG: hypothetical protein KA450_10895 [Bacteroidia bacterium]|nr:hypothetical protein [Bacteroidota bacterium]MBP6413942.1 hypothetical protein [Bacteroidia bacterium]
MKHYLYFLLLLTIVSNSCKKDKTEPMESPIAENPVTSTQKKFLCLIDGILFETDSSIAMYYIDSLNNSKFMGINGIDLADTTSVTLSFIDSTIHKKINLNDTIFFDKASALMIKQNNGVTLNYDGYSGYLIFTALDTINNFVSGKFKCSLVELSVNDTVHITNGRFQNVHYEIN